MWELKTGAESVSVCGVLSQTALGSVLVLYQSPVQAVFVQTNVQRNWWGNLVCFFPTKKNNNKSYELDTCCVELSFLFATHNGSVSPLSNAVYSICPPPILSSDVRHSPSRLAVTASSFKPSCEYAAVYDCALRGMSNGDVTVSWLALWFNSMSCIYFCLLRLYFYGYIWVFFFIYLCYPMHRILNMQLFNVTYRTNDML